MQRTFKKRHYDTIAALIDDLRLIFTNAEKYNSNHKGKDTVSGRAYDAAEIMSAKLETAINKLLLSVSDRLERERIDHANAEREIEAIERAEEAEIRATWKKQSEAGGEAPGSAAAPEQQQTRGDMLQQQQQRFRIVRRLSQKRQDMDFDIPAFDEEDDGQHERSYFEVVKFQKARFEKQRQELSKMRKVSASIGVSSLTRLLQRRIANEELKRQAAASIAAGNPSAETVPTPNKEEEEATGRSLDQASAVLGELEKEGRKPLQISLAAPKPKKKTTTGKRKRALQGF